MRTRLLGLPFLVFAGIFAALVFAAGFRNGKVILGIPLFSVTGGWLVAFGYPVRDDGLTPPWWRLGLVASVIAATVATAVVLD